VETDNLFAKLKRRKLCKVAVAYAIIGWLLALMSHASFPETWT
jgi:hypothetical protein